MPREQRPLILIILVLVGAAMTLEIVNGRFWLSDFRVYYSAADAVMHGRQVYGIPFGEGTGFYKYAPVVALGFVPFALLPYGLAAGVHFALIGLALAIVFVRVERLLMRHVFGAYPSRILLRGILALLCIAVLLSRELHLGNINLWLVVGVVLTTEALLEGDDAWAGVLLGVLWLVKPYLAFIAVPLVTASRWRSLFSAGVIICMGLILPLFLLGPDRWLQLHQEWLQAMGAHSGYLTSPDTFRSLLTRYLPHVPILHPGLLIAVIGVLFTALCWWQRRRALVQEHLLPLQMWTAFALVPQLIITDQEHFLYSLPLILFLIGRLFQRRDLIATTSFILAMFLYATRSSDLWGSPTEALWVQAGVLGIGNLLLALTAVWCAARRST